MKLSEARRYRAAIERASAALPDEEALEVPNLFPAWDGGAAYALGDRVQYGGVLYRCVTAHTAQTDWTPEAAPSLWTRVLIPDETVIPAWEQPDSTNPYMTGDKVTHNAKTWVSDVDNNVWEPGVYGWTEITE